MASFFSGGNDEGVLNLFRRQPALSLRSCYIKIYFNDGINQKKVLI